MPVNLTLGVIGIVFGLANDRSYRIGSRPDNDFVLEQNDVSRHHAILRVRDSSLSNP